MRCPSDADSSGSDSNERRAGLTSGDNAPRRTRSLPQAERSLIDSHALRGRGQAFDCAERAVDLVLVERDVLELAGEISVVGAHVEVAVPRQVEQDRPLLACL